MTGGWIDDSDMMNIRKPNNLGKNGCPLCHTNARWDSRLKKLVCKNRQCGHEFTNNQKWHHPVFPKTRRLVMEGGVPCRPPGWVLVRPVADDLFYKTSVPASRAVQVTEPLSEAVAEPEKKIETPPEPKAPPQKETWENCNLKWTPNDGMLTASQGSSKATVKGKELVPEKYFNKLIKKKKAVIATVEVEPYGNAFLLVKII